MDHKVAAKALEDFAPAGNQQGHKQGSVSLLVPPSGTIARRLIDGWLDGT